jgi:hypothetical protein
MAAEIRHGGRTPHVPSERNKPRGLVLAYRQYLRSRPRRQAHHRYSPRREKYHRWTPSNPPFARMDTNTSANMGYRDAGTCEKAETNELIRFTPTNTTTRQKLPAISPCELTSEITLKRERTTLASSSPSLNAFLTISMDTATARTPSSFSSRKTPS